MAKKKKDMPEAGSINNIMGIVGGVILVTFIVVMFILTSNSGYNPKVKLPSDFNKAKNVLVEFNIQDRGKVQLNLRNDLMPKTVKNFVKNILDGAYNDTDFYRVDNYLVQTGFNQEGMKQEQPTVKLKADPYAISMAKEVNTNLESKSIFFIMKAKNEDYYLKYAIFGNVANVESKNVVDNIQMNDKIVSARLVSLDGKPFVTPAPKK